MNKNIKRSIIPSIGVIMSLIGFGFLIATSKLDYEHSIQKEFKVINKIKIYNIIGTAFLFAGFLIMQSGVYLELFRII